MSKEIVEDSNGNKYAIDIKASKGKIIYKQVFILPPGKSTLKGEYPKFKSDCAFPDRQSCNYGIGFERCEYMKCKRMGEWYCSYHKTPTDNSNENLPEKEL